MNKDERKEDAFRKASKKAGEEQENYGFIKEEVTPPNRWNKRRKRWGVALTVVLLAVLFGIIARVSYMVSDYFITRLTEDERTPVDLYNPPQGDVEIGDESFVFDGEGLKQYAQLMEGVEKSASALKPCLATVSVVTKDDIPIFSGEEKTVKDTCGVIIADNGVEYLLLVNYSAYFKEAYDSISVSFENGVVAEGTLMAKAEDIDLAIVAVSYQRMSNEEKKGIRVIRVGNSSELSLGSVVLAIGRPNGHSTSVDIGFVTTLNDTQFVTDTSVDVLETNMLRHEGSAGILVDSEGRMVGVISDKYSKGFGCLRALSINEISFLLQCMLNELQPITFGAVFNDLSEELYTALGLENGIIITEVKNDSVAYRSEFRKGDIITKVGSEKIYYASQFFTAINQYGEGASITVTYLRGGQEQTATFTAETKK